MDDDPRQKQLEMLRIAGQCLLIPSYLAVFPIAYGWIGLMLDRYFQTRWLAVVFVFLGLYSGFRQSYFIIKRLRIRDNQNGMEP